MKKMKLEDIKVTSFTTGNEIGGAATNPIDIIYPDPTPGTRCYWCPPATYDNCSVFELCQ